MGSYQTMGGGTEQWITKWHMGDGGVSKIGQKRVIWWQMTILSDCCIIFRFFSFTCLFCPDHFLMVDQCKCLRIHLLNYLSWLSPDQPYWFLSWCCKKGVHTWYSWWWLARKRQYPTLHISGIVALEAYAIRNSFAASQMVLLS